MRRVVIGSRNRVVTTDDTRFVSGAALISDFSAFQQDFETAGAVIWAWYAMDARGRPDIAATLRGTEIILTRLSAYHLSRIFLSTDAVFTGSRGGYSETDTPDPLNDYARIKLAQEELMADFVRLRFTTFGPSYSMTRPLLLEMVAQAAVTINRPGQYFSPISTVSLNRVIDAIVATDAGPRLYHLTSEPITKADCCGRLARAIGVPLPQWQTTDNIVLNLSLKSRTHNFPISNEIAFAVAEWQRLRSA